MTLRSLCFPLAACLLLAPVAATSLRAQAPNTLSPQEKQQGWQLLFDGHDFKGWHSYLQKATGRTAVGKDWSVVDGAIQLSKTNQDPKADYADLVTDGEYANFDLKLEWKARPCIDSGVMFFVHESPQYADSYDTGIEMQIADLACTVPDSRILMERSGDIFDMISDRVEWVRPAGQWNQFEIIADHGHLTLFQNGHQVIDTQLWDAHWNQLIAGTKFAKMPGYSKYHTGHIALQGTEPKGDPGVKLSFRNIMIKPL
ncbi:MAG TPA: DUF1080 domain-containing protein [Terracidiphilus sp.]|nr:DUF1080 domain-containing protein [Terracidiphilus sp.]